MANFTVTVTLDVPALDLHRERSKTVEVSPAYDLESALHLYALVVEDTAQELVQREGWVPPMLQAALANDAKITRIEEIIKSMPAEVRSRIMQVINTSAERAIERWGQGAIED